MRKHSTRMLIFSFNFARNDERFLCLHLSYSTQKMAEITEISKVKESNKMIFFISVESGSGIAKSLFQSVCSVQSILTQLCSSRYVFKKSDSDFCHDAHSMWAHLACERQWLVLVFKLNQSRLPNTVLNAMYT